MLDWPSVTIIVLNYNGLNHLQDCFASFAQIDYPSERLELMLVDNASTDGSVEFMQSHYPQVQVVRSPENVGFAAGNNLGAHEATGQYIVFLNNDTRVDAQFVFGLVKAIQSGPDIVCASAKMLSWDGSQFDFTGSFAQFTGQVYQIGTGQPFDLNQYTEVQPLLFACGGAMMIDRKLFLEVGGFDEDYFIYCEDADLGWRLWLLGYKVVFAPEAIVYHRLHATMDSFSNYRKRVLYKRNALYSVIKNYSDENLGEVLSAILLISVDDVVKQAVYRDQLDLKEYHIKNPTKPIHSLISFDKQNISTLIAIHEVVKHLPQMMKKRRFIQQHRCRSDQEIAPLFRRPFYHRGDGINGLTQYTVAELFGLHQIFAELPRRILVISSDILPYPGMPTTGSGLRAWGVGQGLKSCGHEVLFSMPRVGLDGREEIAPSEVLELAWTSTNLPAILRAVDPDMIVACGWHLMNLLPTEGPGVPVALDQHGPHNLERAYQKYGTPEGNARLKIKALSKADFFTCAGEKQMVYFQDWLTQAGWTEQEQHELTAVIPFSLSPDLPERQLNGELTFVYGGVFLPWQDPSVSLSALVETMERRNYGKLLFFGGKHPAIEINPGIFDELLAQLKKSSHVIAPGMVSREKLITNYTQAHVAIDVMQRNPERELAFTSRTVEYLWCGLPVIYNDYAELSEYIRKYKAGWTVDPADREAITATLNDIFDHPEQVIERGKNAQRLVAERLNWAKTIAPLDNFIRYPRVRPHDFFREQPPNRNATYFLKEMARHYQRGGLSTVCHESWAFLKRQAGFF